jgi:hypothetical protein
MTIGWCVTYAETCLWYRCKLWDALTILTSHAGKYASARICEGLQRPEELEILCRCCTGENAYSCNFGGVQLA